MLAFTLAIVAGLYAGNSPTTILIRAIVIMVASCAVGQVLGWAGKQVLRDYLQPKKLVIDQEHHAALQAISASQDNPAEENAAPIEVR